MGRRVIPMADRFAGEPIDWDDAFWRHVTPEALSGCWLWTANLTDGYGNFSRRIRGLGFKLTFGAHRYALEWRLRRALRAGERACHRCNNRACCNPDHLYAGDAATNYADAKREGRHSHGERHGMAKLHEAAVRDVRSSPEACEVLADRYGVSVATVRDVRRGKTWRHVRAA